MSYSPEDLPPVFLTLKTFVKKTNSQKDLSRSCLIKFTDASSNSLVSLDANRFKKQKSKLRGIKAKTNIKISLCRRKSIRLDNVQK